MRILAEWKGRDGTARDGWHALRATMHEGPNSRSALRFNLCHRIWGGDTSWVVSLEIR